MSFKVLPPVPDVPEELHEWLMRLRDMVTDNRVFEAKSMAVDLEPGVNRLTLSVPGVRNEDIIMAKRPGALLDVYLAESRATDNNAVELTLVNAGETVVPLPDSAWLIAATRAR